MTSSPASSTLSSPTASQLVFALTNVYSQFSFKLSSDGSKYKLWRRIFLDMCKGAKVYGHITGKFKPATDNDEDWEAIDSRIKSWFYSTCDANLLQIISSDDYALADCDSKIDEIELVMQILRQLPPSYHSIVDVITNTKPFPSFLEAKNMLLLHESREESVEPHTDTPLTFSAALYSSTPSAPNGKPKNKSNKGRNFGQVASKGGGGNTNVSASSHSFAGTQGHSQPYFGNSPGQVPPAQPGLLGAPPVQSFGAGAPQSFPTMFSAPQHPSPHTFLPPPVPSSPYLYGQHQSPHPVPVLSAYGQPMQHSTPVPPPPQPSFGGHASQYTDLSSVFQAMSVQPPQDNNFYMDTGASRHMTFNQGTMHSLTPCNSSFIQVGNGAVVPARYIGQCKLPFSPWPLMLKNVLVSDKLIKNLISVRRFTIDNSVSVEFDPFGFTVKDLKTGSFLQRCDSDHHDLYPVLPPSPQSAVASANVVVSFDVWHRRLGHPGAAVFQFLLSRKFITCSSQNSSLCHACQLGKHCRLPFSLSATKTSRVFELIHSDLWTSPVTSLSGFKYYVLFLDDYSHFLWVFPLRAKSELSAPSALLITPYARLSSKPLSRPNSGLRPSFLLFTPSPSASSAEPSQPPAPAATSGHPMTTRSRTGSLKPKQIFNPLVTSDISPIPRSTVGFLWISSAQTDLRIISDLSKPRWFDIPHRLIKLIKTNAVSGGCGVASPPPPYRNGRLNIRRPPTPLVIANPRRRHRLSTPSVTTNLVVIRSAIGINAITTIMVVFGLAMVQSAAVCHHTPPYDATIATGRRLTDHRRPPQLLVVAVLSPYHRSGGVSPTATTIPTRPVVLAGVWVDNQRRHHHAGGAVVVQPLPIWSSQALYGLKQAPRAWYHRFAVYLSSLGFLSSKTDTSLFTYHRGSDTIYLLLYVDDIILTASSPTLISMVISKLSSEFPMSDLGPLSFFLGIAASRSRSGLFLSQSAFAQEILARADMVSCNPCSTPADTRTKLAVDGEPVPDPTLYRSLAGALQYLTFTRPDIAYAVQQVCLFMHDPRLTHLNALKRILRYLKGTLSHGLHIKASVVDRLVAYSDADWADCPNTRRSTSGFCVYLGDNLVSWSSKRQHVVSRSSAEAEYRGIANVVAETAWLRNLLLELCCPLSRATVVFCDNVSAMYLASNPVQHQRTKHVEIDLHFVRERVAIGHVRVLHVPSAYQYADIFTKGLPSSLFLDFRDSLNIRVPPDQTTGCPDPHLRICSGSRFKNQGSGSVWKDLVYGIHFLANGVQP
ncbi:hypothetical protein OSB04_004077 [Centaurea solstitialis]|uniref:Uncharacterized protein n=1 Tax=Centaurea solstitialis TaxID=347529 RepID=A0AA38U8J2_9ASTR|nr:hypothetical protein OSB04_004077 [Centaurea solstitialis]